jgi:hypothetical protein
MFAVVELDDPLEPGRPFVKYGTLQELEHEYWFSRNSVPPHIKLTTGRAARERTITEIIAEYDLPPAQRFRTIEADKASSETDAIDPESWKRSPYFCLIELPPELGDDSVRYWAGNRSHALSHPVWRQWFFHPHSKVFHGLEAAEKARESIERSESHARN